MASVTTDRRQGVSSSASIKVACIAASTANLTLSGEQTVDGIALVTDDRVLVKNQTDATENGIYEVNTSSWTRAPDWDGAYDVVEGTIVPVSRGTANSDTMWRVSNTGAITVGSTSITFEAAGVNDSSTVSFLQAGAGAVATTVQSKLREYVSAKDFGAVGDGATDDRAAIAAADTASSGDIIFDNGTFKVSSNLTIASNVIFHNGAMLSPDIGVTITINGDIQAGITQIFTGAGTITGLSDKVYLEWFGAVATPTDSAAAIQSALDFKADELTVYAGGLFDYQCNDALTITGSRKVLDLKGHDLTFTFTDKVGILIDSAAEKIRSGIHNAELWFDTCSGNANVGIRISGKQRYVDNRNIRISYVGLGKSGGVGYEVVGATGGDTPFFGNHTNITCNQCYNGFYVYGLNGDLSSDVTSQLFENCYASTPQGYGLKVAHSSNNTFINLNIESSAGNSVELDDTARNMFYGGIIEGASGVDWLETNRRTITNFPLVQSNYGTLTITKYENIPDVHFDDQLYIKKFGMPLIGMTNTEIIQFPAIRGVLTVQTRRGGWARFLLSTTTDTTTKQVTILESFTSGDTWSITKGTAGLNVYWNSTDSKWELENLTTLSQTVSCNLISE